jgi:putative acyl-CoA dehydrogenase
MTTTHEVFNQVPPLAGHDAADVPALLEAVEREGAGWCLESLHEVGELVGRPETQELGRLAEAHPPRLHTHDRYGHRIDSVEYDPSYHQLMATAVRLGLHGAAWRDDRAGAHVARAATFFVWGQTDPGHGCPISMTYAVVPALRKAPELAAQYEPLLTSAVYEPALAPPLSKAGLIAGMSMTEKQGGSDVRAGTTRAVEQPDGSYRLTGHKWFTSAPNSDLFLVLAQAPGGLTCFLLPRVLPDGTLNGMRLQRLKDKLGNRSNASSEVEYDDAVAHRVGDEGRGVKTIIEMVNMTRLDCVIGSAGVMRTGVQHATHHATHRAAFGKQLLDQPLMRNVLTDLAIEAEAAITVAMRLAGASDRAARGDESEALLRRIGLAATKYFVCKRGPGHAAEALECLGGNGYVEDSGLPRLYREAPLLSVWEGSGNVAALDTLRAMVTQPETVEAFFGEVALATGADARLDRAAARLKDDLVDLATLEHRARHVVEQMALVLQGALLVRHGHPAVADAFCASRLDGQHGSAYGTLPAGVDTAAILARATPKVP